MMVNTIQLISRDLQHIWHPCMQMKDFESCPPIIIERAKGSYLYTDKGPLIDAISSWWCKSLGHGHPAILDAIHDQLNRFEHVIGANTTYPAIVELAEQLTEISRKQHVFFASDGASAVEIAMKLAIHAMQLKGHSSKNQFIALKNGYHGESLGTMSVSDLGIYKAAYPALEVPCHFINTIPYVTGVDDPLWQDCSSLWSSTLLELNALCDTACALILEPIVQGAGGMRCYSADFLKKLATWAKSKGIYLIADEIMTGLGRTGSWLASDHAGINPDLICLSKGLTSGALALSCVMIDHELYDLFYTDYHEGKSFLHSNTYSGNPLAVSAALATLKTIKNEELIFQAKTLQQSLMKQLTAVAHESKQLTQLRGIGGIVAAELNPVKDFRIGNAVYQQALKHGALIRPIGNTLYWLPPLNIDQETIGKLAEITLNSIQDAYFYGEHHV